MALESRKSMIGDQKLVFEHPHLFAGGDGACAPAGGLHSPFYSLDCLPPDFNLFPCNMEHNIGPVDFPIGQQCLPEISWGTPQPLTPTRDLGGGSLDLLEGTSSTPWSSAGYDDDILREFSSAAQDLDIGLLEPIVGSCCRSTEFEGCLPTPLRLDALHEVTTAKAEGDVDINSRYHFSEDNSLSKACDSPVLSRPDDPKQGHVTPRRVRPRRMFNSAPDLTMDFLDVGGYLDMPLTEAARALAISRTALKMKMRQLGMTKWPSRKRNSLRRLLETLQTQGGPTQEYDRDLSQLTKMLRAEINTHQGNSENWPLIQKLRNSIFKNRFLHRHGMLEPNPPATPPQTSPHLPSAASCSSPPTTRSRGALQPASATAATAQQPLLRSGTPVAVAASPPDNTPPGGVSWGAHRNREGRRRSHANLSS